MGKKFNKNQLILIYFSLIASAAILFCTIILFFPQKNKHYHSTVSIRPGFTLGKISNLLFEKNVISNKRMFELAALIMGKEKEFPIGTFQLINAYTNYKINKGEPITAIGTTAVIQAAYAEGVVGIAT